MPSVALARQQCSQYQWVSTYIGVVAAVHVVFEISRIRRVNLSALLRDCTFPRGQFLQEHVSYVFDRGWGFCVIDPVDFVLDFRFELFQS